MNKPDCPDCAEYSAAIGKRVRCPACWEAARQVQHSAAEERDLWERTAVAAVNGLTANSLNSNKALQDAQCSIEIADAVCKAWRVRFVREYEDSIGGEDDARPGRI
jgi:hypothetical protein